MAASLDEQVSAFRTRRLDAAYPYLWVDARYEHVREDGRVVSMAVVVAYGVRADGVREVLGLDVGLSEDVAFWREFFQGLVARGLRGVQLVISDAHPGLKRAIRKCSWARPGSAVACISCGTCSPGCPRRPKRWSRPRCARSSSSRIARPPSANCARSARRLQAQFPQAVSLLEEAEEEIFTFYDFPTEHRRQIYSTNPLERLNKELKRRSAVVGIFPNRAAVIRLLGALLVEQNDEWLVGRHYFSEASMHKLLHPPPGTPLPMPLEAPAS